MEHMTLAELSRALHKKQVSSVEVTQHYLKKIKASQKDLNAFITISEESALQEAKQADERLAKHEATALTGIPIAQKDIFCTKGILTTCGSKMLNNFIAPYDATVVSAFKNAGSVMIGKTNMDEFAMGSSNETSHYGPVKNPWDLSCTPGGSSGGSAAAVAARIVPAATGTDTGGSIRQPAALCGITGLKPTYGRVSRYGMIAFASSLDQAGPMAQTAEDCALLLEAMAGHDFKDSTSIPHETSRYSEELSASLAGLRIGLPEEYFQEGLEPEIEAAIQETCRLLEKEGAQIKKIRLPHTHLAVPAYYVLAPAEASSNLARYDGVRYGYRAENPVNLLDLYERTRSEGFGKEVKRRILIGTYVLSAGYYDAYYLKAQKIRQLMRQDFVDAFKEVDVILTPTSPTPAFPLGARLQDPIKMYLADIFTIAVNLAGLPGISIPCGFSKGLPIGLQLIGSYFSEGKLLNVAHRYQQLTDWHQQQPAAFKTNSI